MCRFCLCLAFGRCAAFTQREQGVGTHYFRLAARRRTGIMLFFYRMLSWSKRPGSQKCPGALAGSTKEGSAGSMLARLQIELRTAQGDFIPYQKAAVLQSILMEQVGETYASLLHKSELHPYSQSVIRQNEKNIWNITTTNQDAFQHILLPLLDSEFRAFTM